MASSWASSGGEGVRARRCDVASGRHGGSKDQPATTRASFAAYNTPGEIDVLVEALHDARRVFGL